MVAIITGASRGIGYSIAEIFAANGYDLVITSLNAEKLSAAEASLKERNPKIKVTAKAFDLSKPAEAKKFAKWCIGITERIDVLVNNAGSFAGANVQD